MIDVDLKIAPVLKAYQDRIHKEEQLMNSLPNEEAMKKRNEFLLSVGPEVGSFLNTLIKSSKSKCILEVGTSYGYSTLFMAEAARHTGGKVISLEIDPQKAAYAEEQIEKAHLKDYVEFRVGDALESIARASEKFDFVLIDIWKSLYLPSFKLILPKLEQGAWILGDNMIHPPAYKKEARAYREAVKETGAFDTLLLPIGSGLEVSYFRPKDN